MKSKIHEHQKNNYSIVSKKQLSILGIFITLLFSACSDDSNSSQEKNIKGQWKLVQVSGSIVGFLHNFEPGTITWTFDPTINRVTIVNNNTDHQLMSLFETGQYNFQVQNSYNPEICSKTLEINTTDLGCLSVVNDTLTISQNYADGYSAMLVR